jgi:hypothetical protein
MMALKSAYPGRHLSKQPGWPFYHQVSRNPAAIGNLAALIAGNSPPSDPMIAAKTMACSNSAVETRKAKVT